MASLGAASTLERHHAAVTVALLSSAAFEGVLRGLAPCARARVLHLLPRLIAATDIERHGAHIDVFAATPQPPPEVAARDDNDVDEDALLAAREAYAVLLLKAADLSNAAKPWPAARRWAGLLKAEHMLLAEREADAGLAVSPFLLLPMPQLCQARPMPCHAHACAAAGCTSDAASHACFRASLIISSRRCCCCSAACSPSPRR